MQKNKGFTLIEVLVAMFILSVALVAITESFTTISRNSYNLRQHYFATLVGQNFLASEKIEPGVGLNKISSSVTEMAGRKWYVDAIAEKTIFPLVEKVIVEVFENKKDKNPLVILNTYREAIQ